MAGPGSGSARFVSCLSHMLTLDLLHVKMGGEMADRWPVPCGSWSSHNAPWRPLIKRTGQLHWLCHLLQPSMNLKWAWPDEHLFVCVLRLESHLLLYSGDFSLDQAWRGQTGDCVSIPSFKRASVLVTSK